MENVNNFEVQNVTSPQEEIYSNDGRAEQIEADQAIFSIAEMLYEPHKVEQQLIDRGEVLHPSTR